MTRAATGFCHYPGDATAAIAREIETGQPFGPNYVGEFMWPVSADFDPETNRTRVGFSLIPPQEWTP